MSEIEKKTKDVKAIEKQQWKKRVDLFRFIYGIIQDNNYEKDYVVQEAFKNYDFDVNEIKIIEYFSTNYEKIRDEILPFVKIGWSWERISPISKAILLSSVSECECNKIDKKIVIDQAVITAKNYAERDQYKFINAILDRVLK